jgi:hypothetical protein
MSSTTVRVLIWLGFISDLLKIIMLSVILTAKLQPQSPQHSRIVYGCLGITGTS